MGHLDLSQRARSLLAGIVGAFIASICCAGPLILAAAGFMSVAAAGMLATNLFSAYWPAFVGGGLISSICIFGFSYRRDRCAVGEERGTRSERLAGAWRTVLVFVIAYLIWDVVIVEAAGVLSGAWPAPKV